MARKRLGTLLEEQGLINEFQLVAALSHQRKWKGKLGKSLIELGYLEEQQLYEVLAGQLEMTLVDLRDRKIAPEILNKISRKDAEALKAVPVEIKEGKLVVAVAVADLPELQAKLSQAAGQPVELVLGLESLVESWVARISKIPVAAVQPVKKAFFRNSNGDIELAPDHIQVEPPPAEKPPPAPVEAQPPAQKEAPVALEEQPAAPEPGPAPAEEAKAPEPEMAPPGPEKPAPFLDLEVPDLDLPPPMPPPMPPPAPVSAEPTPPPPPPPPPPPAAAKRALDLDAPELESALSEAETFEAAKQDKPLELDVPGLTPPPRPNAGEGTRTTKKEAPEPSSEDLWAMPEPAPPSPTPAPEPFPVPELPAEDLPPPPSLEVPEEERESGKAEEPAPPSLIEEPLPPPPAEEPVVAQPAEVDLSLLEEIPLPDDEIEEIKPQEAAPAPPPPPEEEPVPLEDREPLPEPVAPLEGLVTEEVKAESVEFQQELHKVRESKGEKPAESGLEIAFQKQIEGRVAKLEEELQKLRETVEDLRLKVKR